jgi:hemolysin activation/secretion protein
MREVTRAPTLNRFARLRRAVRLGRRVAACALTGVLLGASGGYAQVPTTPPFGDPTGRSGEPRPLPQEPPRPLPAPGQILPPLSPPPSRDLLPRARVFVREIRVVGSTVFTPAQLAAMTAPYVDREVTSEDLEALRLALTRLYIDRGYITSGVILPDQNVADGVITYQVIEGKLVGIDVEGNRWLRGGYYRRRLALGAEPPLHIDSLQERLRLMLEDPRIERLNAALKPGISPGYALLDVHVEERFPISVWIDFNNYQSPSVGAERGIVTIENLSLTGNADHLTLRYGRSEGLDPLLDFRYAVPVTPLDTIAAFQYRRNDVSVIDEQFKVLRIESASEVFTLSVRHPVYRKPGMVLALELIGERLSNETTLLGRPFSLEPAAENGRTVVTALRTAQEFVYRDPNQVIAVRSRLSVGLDALGSTIHDLHENPENQGIPDSRFLTWLGQFQWVRRLDFFERIGVPDVQILFRSDLQLSDDALPTLEQIAIGGRYSVRGYRENTFVRDNAFLASLEARIPLARNRPWADYLHLAPFVDYGRGWNHQPLPQSAQLDISSVGIGLRWGLNVRSPVIVRPQFEIYWGYPFRKVETIGGNIQDDGIHFQFLMGFF